VRDGWEQEDATVLRMPGRIVARDRHGGVVHRRTFRSEELEEVARDLPRISAGPNVRTVEVVYPA